MLHLYFSRYPLDLLPPCTHLETLSSPWRGHGTCPWHSRCSASPHRRHPGWRWPRHMPRHLGDEVTEKISGLWISKMLKHFSISKSLVHGNGKFLIEFGFMKISSDFIISWPCHFTQWRVGNGLSSMEASISVAHTAYFPAACSAVLPWPWGFETRKTHTKVWKKVVKRCGPHFQVSNCFSLFGGYYSVLLKLSFQYKILQ
jgi:hypothetical protein